MDKDAHMGAGGSSEPAPGPPPEIPQNAESANSLAVDDLPHLGDCWKNVATNVTVKHSGPWRSVVAAPVVQSANNEKSGENITCTVLFTAAAHDAKPVSGDAAPGGAAYLAKSITVNANVHDVNVLSAAAAPLALCPAEADSPRMRVDIVSKAVKGAVPLIAVVASLSGDSADIWRLLHAVSQRMLTSTGRGPDGLPHSVKLQVRAHALATVETLERLASSQTHLPNGSPMLVSAPRDGTLGELQRLLESAVGSGYGAVLQMPESHTATSDHRVLAAPRDEGAVKADNSRSRSGTCRSTLKRTVLSYANASTNTASASSTQIALKTCNPGDGGWPTLTPVALLC